MKFNRAYRRERITHIKKVVSKYWRNKGESADARRIGIIANSRANCSCWMCGNDRKHFNRKTIKETSDINMMKLDMKDL